MLPGSEFSFLDLTQFSLMDLINGLSLPFSFFGLFLFVRVYLHQKKEFSKKGATEPLSHSDSSLQIVVPCRNEEKNLDKLLPSLGHFVHQTLIVNDQSTDQTLEKAKKAGCRVLDSSPLLAGWRGKNWACQQAFNHLNPLQELTLFTDADTLHSSERIREAMVYQKANSIQLLSSAPFHLCPTFWERSMGVFHFLILFAAGLFHDKKNPPYAIGQFLMFETSFYKKIGGHQKVYSEAVDDIELAKLTFSEGGRYDFSLRPFYSVRMYPDFRHFLAGWHRILFFGQKYSNAWDVLKVGSLVSSLLGLGLWNISVSLALTWTLTLWIFVWRLARPFGEFGLSSAFLAPLSLLLFGGLSLKAGLSYLFKQSVIWKGRPIHGHR